MKPIYTNLLCALSLVILAGCASKIDHTQACANNILLAKQQATVKLAKLQLGMGKQQVLGYIGLPDSWESYTLRDGRNIEVIEFGGNQACDALGGPVYNSIPLVISRGYLIGYGTDYYNNFIKPAIPQPANEVYVPNNLQPTSEFTTIRY